MGRELYPWYARYGINLPFTPWAVCDFCLLLSSAITSTSDSIAGMHHFSGSFKRSVNSLNPLDQCNKSPIKFQPRRDHLAAAGNVQPVEGEWRPEHEYYLQE